MSAYLDFSASRISGDTEEEQYIACQLVCFGYSVSFDLDLSNAIRVANLLVQLVNQDVDEPQTEHSFTINNDVRNSINVNFQDYIEEDNQLYLIIEGLGVSRDLFDTPEALEKIGLDIVELAKEYKKK